MLTARLARAPIEAVTFDLDDTLFPQAQFLAGAWRSVAAAAAAHGIAQERCAALHADLARIAAEGSDRGGIIDRALAASGLPGSLTAPLVAAFRAHAPARLEPYPGVPGALRRLRRWVRIGCLTDGDPVIQRAKLAALGLADAFDAIVISDELGRGHRKPHPLPFLTLLDALGVDPVFAVHIGDRPGKDVLGAHAVGMRAVRVRTGEYAGVEGTQDAVPAAECADVIEAARLVERLIEGCRRVGDPAGRRRPVRTFEQPLGSR